MPTKCFAFQLLLSPLLREYEIKHPADYLAEAHRFESDRFPRSLSPKQTLPTFFALQTTQFACVLCRAYGGTGIALFTDAIY